MSKTTKRCLALFVIFLLITISIVAYIVIHNASTLDGVISLDSNSMEYLNLKDGTDYWLVDSSSVEKGYFDEDTHFRLTRTIKFDSVSQKEIKIFDKAHIGSSTKIVRVDLNSDEVIYINLVNGRYGKHCYVKNTFKLPEIIPDNISKIDVFVYDGTDERAQFPLFTFTSYDEIDYFISHYNNYIDKYTSEETGDLACFIEYKNFTFVEQLNEYEWSVLFN